MFQVHNLLNLRQLSPYLEHSLLLRIHPDLEQIQTIPSEEKFPLLKTIDRKSSLLDLILPQLLQSAHTLPLLLRSHLPPQRTCLHLLVRIENSHMLDRTRTIRTTRILATRQIVLVEIRECQNVRTLLPLRAFTPLNHTLPNIRNLRFDHRNLLSSPPIALTLPHLLQ